MVLNGFNNLAGGFFEVLEAHHASDKNVVRALELVWGNAGGQAATGWRAEEREESENKVICSIRCSALT